ncbi:CaiB/BaiF CoA transferase family protein [Rhodococcus sp. NPDC056960]|uniref:CaiB/BaiF CoA transferase family protein n=1 Tax=Rhodococcus TaxID=1827 RepID=UPI0036431787
MSEGPLTGIRVLDLSSIGPGPFCGMILADHGAEVIEVLKPSPTASIRPDGSFGRGKRSIMVDLRDPAGADVVRRLAGTADVLIEGNRPGTLERRGLGPEELLEQNPRLVYVRLTGWGQTGPYADRAGHDINYISTVGMLGALGTTPKDAPTVPQALVGDLAGGAMFALLGAVMALFEREHTGVGQVVDASIVDGVATLLTPQLLEFSQGRWSGRGGGVLGGSAPFYGAYRCADGQWFSVGAIEPAYFERMLEVLGLESPASKQFEPAAWPELRSQVSAAFSAQPRAYWEQRFAEVDACGTAVLNLDELTTDPHLAHRRTIVDRYGRLEAAPAPRFPSKGVPEPRPTPRPGEHTLDIMMELGVNRSEVKKLLENGVLRQS